MLQVGLSHPWYLLLLPLFAAGAWHIANRSLADLSTARFRWSLSVRLTLVTLLILALAGLQFSLPAKRLAILFVLDQSDSIPAPRRQDALDYINRAAKRMGPDDEAGLIVFGADAYVEMQPGASSQNKAVNIRQVHSVPGRDYTHLAGAIRLALAAFPDNAQRRIVILSDGNENLGDSLQEVAANASEPVPIDVVPVEYRYDREVLLEKMALPSDAKIGEPFEIRVIARSTIASSGVLRLLRNGSLIAQQKVDLLPGPNVITFQQSLEEARFHTYEALIDTPADEIPENNRALGFVLVKGKPRVLIVDSNPADARYLSAALAGQQLQVDVRAPAQLPSSLAEFQTYDSVVLSNVPAYQLTADQMKAIRSSVRDLGTGLVMIGGEYSFGPGAYRGTPIEEALPVDMEVRKQKIMPIGAVAMVLHTCEFPDGNRWAAETAAAVVDVLGERDKVGVLLYGMGGEEWGIRMQPASNKPLLKSQIYNLSPGDAPAFHPLMQMGYTGLTTDARDAAVKHMIIISDGDPTPPTQQLMNQIAASKITVSTVAVFPHGGGTGTLETVARVGKGQFYNVKNAEEIPRIFLKEAQRVLKPAIIEERFRPVRTANSELLTGIDSTPALLGYVATSPKQAPGVEVSLQSRREDPILASWRFGLGKSVAFMSDAKNRWAASWLASGTTFNRLWAQTVRWTVRSTSRANLDAQVEIQQRRGHVVADVVNPAGEFVNLLDIRGSVAGQTQSPPLRMNQTAPGRYEGEFDATEKGQYLVALRYTDKGGTPRIHTLGAAVPYSPEYRNLTANTALLTGLAERSKGRVLTSLSQQPPDSDVRAIWRHDSRTMRTPQELWPILLLAAALLLPLDIGIRRLMLTTAEFKAAAFETITKLRGGGAVQTERQESMGGLLKAKSRAGRRLGGSEAPDPASPRPVGAEIRSDNSPSTTTPEPATPVASPEVGGGSLAGSLLNRGRRAAAPPAPSGKSTLASTDAGGGSSPQPAQPPAAPPSPRAAAAPQAQAQASPSAARPATEPTDRAPDPDADSARNRLLEAKRRARERRE